MNGPAAKELTDVMMLDDYVARMAGLKQWNARWMATLDLAVEFNPPLNLVPVVVRRAAIREGVKSLTESILHALRDESQHVTKINYTDSMVMLKVVFVRMEPQE